MVNEPKLLTIKRHFERPKAIDVAFFGECTTCWIGDALGGRGAMDSGIKPIVAGPQRLSGTAITVQAVANSNAAIFAAIEFAKPGDIIVASVEGFSNAAVVGDVLAGMAMNKGIAAIVVDGMVRDIEGLREVGLPIWARGLTPNSCSREGIGRVGFAAVVGQQHIRSGDIVVIDEDGVIAVPIAGLELVKQTIEEIKAAEKAILETVAAGAILPPAIQNLLASDKVQIIE